jgi:hypothetical protein
MAMIIYEDVFKGFQKKNIEYIIVGGIAANLLGLVRATADLDIMIDVEEDNLVKMDAVLRYLGYKIKQPVDIKKLNKISLAVLIKNKNLKALNYNKTGEFKEIDIIVDSPVSFEQAKKKAKKIIVNGLKLPVISIDDLIKMKEKAGRAIDKFDVTELKKVRRFLSQ